MKYPLGEHPYNAPPINPNPPDVDVILMMTSHPQSEHLPFNTIVDLSGLALNILLSIFIMGAASAGR